MTDDNKKLNADTQSIPSSVNPDAKPAGDETNRLRLVELSADAMLEILQGRRHIEDGLPDDVTIHRAGYDQERDVFYLVVDHDEYDKILEAERRPVEDIKTTMGTKRSD